MKKICKECKKAFEGRNNKIFCFIKCRSKFNGKRRNWKKANYNRNRGRLKQFYCSKTKVLQFDYDDFEKYDWVWINKMI